MQVLNKFADILVKKWALRSGADAFLPSGTTTSKLHNKSIIFSIRFMAFESREGRVQAVQNVRAGIKSILSKAGFLFFLLQNVYKYILHTVAVGRESICIKERRVSLERSQQKHCILF